MIYSLLLLASVLSFAAAAPTKQTFEVVKREEAPAKVCGAEAGTDCPPQVCVDAGAMNGKCVKDGNTITWTGNKVSYPKPTDAENKNCGAAAGTDCPDFVCVDKKYGGKGGCTENDGSWTFNDPSAALQTTSSAPTIIIKIPNIMILKKLSSGPMPVTKSEE